MRRKSNLIPKLHVKKGDNVKVIAGVARGKSGRIIEMDIDKRRAKVEGLNIISKHSKPSASKPEGGILKMEASIHISNLMLIDPKSGEPTRVGRRLNKDNKLVRYAVKSKEEIKK